MIRKLLLSGIQDFSKIRNEYNVYVDKTAYIHKMIKNYNTVFFSRPHRLGKYSELFLARKKEILLIINMKEYK